MDINNDSKDDVRQLSSSVSTLLNQLISTELITSNGDDGWTRSVLSSTTRNSSSVVAECQQDSDWIAVVLYSEVVLRNANWIKPLLKSVLYEFTLNPSVENVLFDRTYLALQSHYEDIKHKSASNLLTLEETSKVTNTTTTKSNNNNNNNKSKKKGGKEARIWHDGKGKLSKEMMASLDRSDEIENDANKEKNIENALREARAAYLPAADEIPLWEQDESFSLNDNYDDDDENVENVESSSGWGSSLKGLIDQMSGNKVLTEQDLKGPLQEMEKLLTSKNVASDISIEICNQVRKTLVGKRLASFHRVKTAVRQALEQALTKILHPTNQNKKQISSDLLSAVTMKREQQEGSFFSSSKDKKKKPFVIVMVGINGVGKSTSLAKISYYLKSNGCNPLLAACDTFRSGAVEQLNVHAKCLDVPLYHKGYAKDPSSVAAAAIQHAENEGHDVVMVDTAGRMQNNVPLMKALSKLVVENDPDLVLFVCEALVGNDGMDQLVMFNKALRSGGHARQIDGVMLTKFDTVSDKVGAALTMTHVTGSPIYFVGTGQKYNHLKKLSVPSVIQSLFS